MVALDVRRVPAAVRAVVIADAEARNLSVNATIVRALAIEYGVEPPGLDYPFIGSGGGGDHWLVRMPESLRDRLRADAREAGGTMTGMLLHQLQQHYRLPSAGPVARRADSTLPDDLLAEARRRNREEGESVRSLARELGVNREKLRKALKEE